MLHLPPLAGLRVAPLLVLPGWGYRGGKRKRSGRLSRLRRNAGRVSAGVSVGVRVGVLSTPQETRPHGRRHRRSAARLTPAKRTRLVGKPSPHLRAIPRPPAMAPELLALLGGLPRDPARPSRQMLGNVRGSVLADGWRAAPPLLFCFGSPRREQAARRALAATRDSAAVRIATAAIDPHPHQPGRAGLVAAVRPHGRPGAADRPGRRAARPMAGLPGATGTPTPRDGRT